MEKCVLEKCPACKRMSFVPESRVKQKGWMCSGCTINMDLYGKTDVDPFKMDKEVSESTRKPTKRKGKRVRKPMKKVNLR